jgi:hypothetical protein
MDDRENRLRTALHREVERVRVKPEMSQRVQSRIRRPAWRNAALALSVAALVLAAGIVAWFVAGSRDVRQEVVSPPNETAQAQPETAFHCFIEARRERHFESASACMTDRYASTITDPLEIIGASSPSVERATIVSSSGTGGRVVFNALTYWGSSTGLAFVSEGTIEVVRDGDDWLVDDWEEGQEQPIGETTAVTLHFLPVGRAPECSSDNVSFVAVERRLPSEAVVDDLALGVVRELFSGPWNHEGASTPVFPAASRVNVIGVSDGVALVGVNGFAYRATECSYVMDALRASLATLPGIDDVRVTRTQPDPSPEPDV